MIKAFLFGSVGVLAETSELQRRAYNAAFELNNIEWRGNIGTYCSLLADPGGKNRLYRFSGGDLTAAEITKIHSDKQDFFDDFVRAGIKPRPGCVEIIRKCKANNIKVGLVTTTTPETLASLKIGLAGLIDFDDFDVVTTKESVEKETLRKEYKKRKSGEKTIREENKHQERSQKRKFGEKNTKKREKTKRME